MNPPPDRDARERVVAGRDRSIFVEASAGTGKTHAIVETITEVCVRREPRVPLTRIAAVTFTEKAAGDLQKRLRSRLEALLSSNEPDRIRSAARESLEEIDRAQVGTIHAFCSSLLRERPIEAGLIPAFTMILPEASSALASEVWEEWWRQEAAERPDGALGRALLAGMKIAGGEKETTLRTLAAELYEKRARLEDAHLPDADAATILSTAERLRDQARDLHQVAESARHPVAGTLAEIVAWLGAVPDDLDALRSFRATAPVISFRSGGKLDEVERWREKEYKKFLETLEDAPGWPVLVDLLRRLTLEPGGYLKTVAKLKRRQSLMDFDDLLLVTRELLRSSGSARRHFRERYALLVVDEFQDTDPIQMEIFLRLAHGEGGGEDWTKLVPEPGRLLLVGDPKQSIYRFRRADIETYSLVGKLLRADREMFVANRRSVPPILEWVNAVFGEAMAPPVQPFEASYSPLEPWGDRPVPGEKRVVYLDPPTDWRADEESWRKSEAEGIAGLLADAIGRGTLAVESGRPARSGDIAVLVRSNESVGLFQEAFARVGIDAVIEGGLDFFRREEPAAVLAALRAIENPDDRIALYATLKSFLFALSDEDLFLARESGAFFDHRRAESASGPLREALDFLSLLYRSREDRPASETVLDLLSATGALIKARARRVGGLQAQANLHQIVSLAREIEASAPSFGAVVRGLASIGSADASEPRAFEESTDAVRILTVHKAKGLEFPVVVLAGFGGLARPASDGLLAPRRDGPWGVSIKVGAGTISSPDFAAIRRADDEREAAETRRLLYVGATRARDWFFLSRWRKITDSKKGVADTFERTPLAALGPVQPSERIDIFVERRTNYPELRRAVKRPRKELASPAAALRDEIAAIAGRPALLASTRCDLLRRAGGRQTQSEDEPSSDRARADQPGLAARIGCALHDAMERVMRGETPQSAVAAAAAEWDLGVPRHAEIAAMVDALAGSPIVAGPSRKLAEFPILFRSPEDGALVEGKIDLLAEGPEGWTVVDYKTDRIDQFRGEESAIRSHFETYAPQLSEYARGLMLLGVRVVRLCVLSARNGKPYDLPLPS